MPSGRLVWAALPPRLARSTLRRRRSAGSCASWTVTPVLILSMQGRPAGWIAESSWPVSQGGGVLPEMRPPLVIGLRRKSGPEVLGEEVQEAFLVVADLGVWISS